MPETKIDKRIGSQFWKQRSTHGRKPKFDDDEKLWDACQQYFQWCEDNPLLEDKVFHTNGLLTRTTIAHMRAMTIAGMCLYIDICESTWANYREKKDFLVVITRAERYIYDQKFSGASADMLNANIIARDLGLKDRKDITSSDGSMSPKSFNDFYQK